MTGPDPGKLEVFMNFPSSPQNTTGFKHLIFSRTGIKGDYKIKMVGNWRKSNYEYYFDNDCFSETLK